MRLSYPGMSQMRRTELMARAQACYAVRRQANDRAEVETCVLTSTPHTRTFVGSLPILTSIGRMRTVESRFWTAPQPSLMRAGGGRKLTLSVEGTSSCTSYSMVLSCRVVPVHSRL